MNRSRFRNNKNNHHRNDKKIESGQSGDDSNPIVRIFRGYSEELNDKHDRYERIVKYSRDITIESKRLIFLLHTADMRKQNADKILAEAFTRLNNLCINSFASIAKELENCDPYQYGRAYSAGVQEFVEAFTYYDYLINENIMDWNDLQQKLMYKKQPAAITETASTETDEKETSNELQTCLVQPIEYMLGLADLRLESLEILFVQILNMSIAS